MWQLFWRIILRWQYHNVHCDFQKVTVKFNRRRINGEPFGGQLIKAPCFTRATVRLLCGAVRVGKPAEPACKSSYMYISEVREVSGYGSCGTKCGKAHQSTIWGIDESINGTGLPKRACKKMPVPFRHWHFISIQGKIDAYSRKAQKERKVRLYEVTQVFRMGNGILFCHDDDHRL